MSTINEVDEAVFGLVAKSVKVDDAIEISQPLTPVLSMLILHLLMVFPEMLLSQLTQVHSRIKQET